MKLAIINDDGQVHVVSDNLARAFSDPYYTPEDVWNDLATTASMLVVLNSRRDEAKARLAEALEGEWR